MGLQESSLKGPFVLTLPSDWQVGMLPGAPVAVPNHETSLRMKAKFKDNVEEERYKEPRPPSDRVGQPGQPQATSIWNCHVKEINFHLVKPLLSSGL